MSVGAYIIGGFSRIKKNNKKSLIKKMFNN